MVKLLDTLDTSVEKLRKEALKLHESRDQLLIRIEMLKTTDFLAHLKESDKEDALSQLCRINNRLQVVVLLMNWNASILFSVLFQTVDISVKTVRDDSQNDSLLQINLMIDGVIRNPDPILKRQKFLQFYASCSSDYQQSDGGSLIDDKKFEGHLLGCTLDDQKKIKFRVKNLLNLYQKEMCEGQDQTL